MPCSGGGARLPVRGQVCMAAQHECSPWHTPCPTIPALSTLPTQITRPASRLPPYFPRQAVKEFVRTSIARQAKAAAEGGDRVRAVVLDLSPVTGAQRLAVWGAL